MAEFILLFLLGVISTVSLFFLQKKYTRWNALRHEKERVRIKLEEDGWIKTNMIYAHWIDRRKMNKWHKAIEDELELCAWLKENTTGDFKTNWVGGDRYFRFTNDEDMMAFKLRWL